MLDRTSIGADATITVPAARPWLTGRPPDAFVTTRSQCPHCKGTGLKPPVIDAKALVAAIVADFGPLTFTTGELVHYAEIEGGRLLALLDGHDVKRIGWALRAIAGVDLGGYQLKRQGLDRNRVALWRVVVLQVS